MVRSVARSSVAVGLQRGDHLVGRAEMDVERLDQVARASRPTTGCRLAASAAARGQPDFGQAHRLLAIVGDEHRARGQDARLRAPSAAPRDRHRSSGSGSRPARPSALRASAAGCATASARRRPRRRGARPPPRMSPARCDRPASGRADRACRRRQRPPAHALRITSRLRAKISLRWSLPSRPKAVKAVRLPPGPTPTSSRPSQSRSSTAASSATRTGSSSGRVTMPVPRRMREVCGAAWPGRRRAPAGRPRARGNDAARSTPNRSRSARPARSARWRADNAPRPGPRRAAA